jgi:hypothetical protein
VRGEADPFQDVHVAFGIQDNSLLQSAFPRLAVQGTLVRVGILDLVDVGGVNLSNDEICPSVSVW